MFREQHILTDGVGVGLGATPDMAGAQQKIRLLELEYRYIKIPNRYIKTTTAGLNKAMAISAKLLELT